MEMGTGMGMEEGVQRAAVVDCGAQRCALQLLRGTEDGILSPPVPAGHLVGASQGRHAPLGWQPQTLSSSFSC
jgi:hypothetical protein